MIFKTAATALVFSIDPVVNGGSEKLGSAQEVATVCSHHEFMPACLGRKPGEGGGVSTPLTGFNSE